MTIASNQGLHVMTFLNGVTSRALLTAGFFLLLVNSAYLAAFADSHALLLRQRRTARPAGRDPRSPRARGAPCAAAGRTFRCEERRCWPACRWRSRAVLGVALLFTGATTNFRWLLQAHIVSAALGSIVALGWLMARVAARYGSPRQRVALGCAAAVVVAGGLAAGVAAARHDANRRAEHRIVNPTDGAGGDGRRGRRAGQPVLSVVRQHRRRRHHSRRTSS